MTLGEHAWHQFPRTFCIQNPMSKTTRLSVFMASLSVYILSSESGPQNHDMDCRAGGAPLSSKPYLNKSQALAGGPCFGYWLLHWNPTPKSISKVIPYARECMDVFTLESEVKTHIGNCTSVPQHRENFHIGIRVQNVYRNCYKMHPRGCGA